MSDDDLLPLALRVIGAGQVLIGLAHVPMWWTFDWSREIARVTPLTGRVFAVQTFFVAVVVFALGALTALRPDLLLGRDELARILLGFAAIFWCLRLAAQPLVFDAVLWRDSPWGAPIRAVIFAGLAAVTGVYVWALARQLGVDLPAWPAGPAGIARIGVGLVWLVFGVYYKLLRQVPRHERIVARVLGDRVAPVLTRVIGAGEAAIAVWMFSGIALPLCVGLQTVLIAAMNTLELRYARDLLLAPVPMVIANTVLLAVAWYAAMA
jgi:hypothetical protein